MREGSRLGRWLVEGCRAIDALVFPWECALCGGDAADSPFCDVCKGELASEPGTSCWRCAMPLGPFGSQEKGCWECRGRSLGYDAAIALGLYDGPAGKLCRRLKQERDAWLAPWLVDALVDARRELQEIPKDAWVVSIPLHWRRRWKRGYNQADALAESLAKSLSLRRVHPLKRSLATPPLKKSGRAERAKLMRNAFRIKSRAALALKGRTVLLVDDILTTGATCGAAARALKRAGAKRVVVVVIARAEGKV
ncbi:ComF family protein [Singulisphaera sp. PoT]|uniref:ComF family protein n=1 Tax=Singulisphaera sp. PoT TaxID=3411797 RepID=UPI003BF4F0F5